LVFDFNDICHDVPGRPTKSVDLVARGVDRDKSEFSLL